MLLLLLEITHLSRRNTVLRWLNCICNASGEGCNHTGEPFSRLVGAAQRLAAPDSFGDTSHPLDFPLLALDHQVWDRPLRVKVFAPEFVIIMQRPACLMS